MTINPPEREITPQVLADMLSLASEVRIPPEVIATWTPREREDAAGWAGDEHLSASGNPVLRVPKPGVVKWAEEVCSSPALAQLAVESWVQLKDRVEHGEFKAWDEIADELLKTGQAAITGLLVLLKDRSAP
jgi:hypothetical protein